MRSRRWSVLAPLAALLAAPLAPAQTKVESEGVTFETADTVQLQGTLYKAVLDDKTKVVSAKAADDAPVVIILHPFGADAKGAEWDGLATTLAEKGFHVLRFDFRGHGNSTVVSKDFWTYNDNVKVFAEQARKKPVPLKLDPALVKKEDNYLPVLVNDVMAARVKMDGRNDEGKCNTSSVYLIGAGDAAAVGMMYMTAEWTRPAKPSEDRVTFLKTLPVLGVEARESAGKDIAGAIWLSPKRPASFSAKIMQTWANTYTDMRESNPVLCLYGDGDAAGKKESEFIKQDVLVANPKDKRVNPLKLTNALPIKGSKGVGVGLLGKGLTTEEIILDYLTTLEKDRKNVTKINKRNWTLPPYITPAAFGVDLKAN